MENASKALIIAGAILISILLIGVGILVMNSINNPIDEATRQAESQAIEMFNSKFTGYAGEQKSQAVKALMTAISSSNGTSDKKITVTLEGADSTTGKIQSSVESKKTYIVDFTYDDDTGYITAADVSVK